MLKFSKITTEQEDEDEKLFFGDDYEKNSRKEKVIKERVRIEVGKTVLADGDLSFEIKKISGGNSLNIDVEYKYKREKKLKKTYKIENKDSGSFHVFFPNVEKGDRKRMKKLKEEGIEQWKYIFYVMDCSSEENYIDITTAREKQDTGFLVYASNI